MKFRDIFFGAANNLKRNKTRSLLTIIAVFVGATTITLTNGVGDGIKTYIKKQIGSLGASNVLYITQKTGSDDKPNGEPDTYDPSKQTAAANPQGSFSTQYVLTQKDLQKIQGDTDIVTAAPLRTLAVDYITTGGKKYLITADTYIVESIEFDLAAGAKLDPGTAEHQVLIPTTYLKVLGFSSANDAVGEQVMFSVSDQNRTPKEFSAKIVGVTNKSLVSSNGLVLNKALSEEALEYQSTGLLDAQKNAYLSVFAEFKSTLSDAQIKSLKYRLKKAGYNSVTLEDQQRMIFSVIDAIVAVLNIFGIVALVAASFGIINTLFMAVQERTKEIGLMKAVGMSRKKVFLLFSIEAALLGLFGSILGVLAANGLGRLLNNIATRTFLKDLEGLTLLSFKAEAVVTIVVLVTFIAFLSGTLPARRASKLDAIEALRYE